MSKGYRRCRHLHLPISTVVKDLLFNFGYSVRTERRFKNPVVETCRDNECFYDSIKLQTTINVK